MLPAECAVRHVSKAHVELLISRISIRNKHYLRSSYRVRWYDSSIIKDLALLFKKSHSGGSETLWPDARFVAWYSIVFYSGCRVLFNRKVHRVSKKHNSFAFLWSSFAMLHNNDWIQCHPGELASPVRNLHHKSCSIVGIVNNDHTCFRA